MTLAMLVVLTLGIGYVSSDHATTVETAMAMKKLQQGNYADVNGLQMYYEIHGEGRPLV
jgi:hypothetical protein